MSTIRFSAWLTILISIFAVLHNGRPARAVDQPVEQYPSSSVSTLVNDWLKRPELKRTLIGIEIMELPSGHVLYSYNGDRRFVPASTMKVITTACAFDTMGGDYRYHTKLASAGEIKGDRLKGDLLVLPSQNPALDIQDVWRLVNYLSTAKIRNIEGHVRISSLAPDYFYPGWLAEDWGQEWMPVSSDLVIDRNVAPTADPGRGIPADNDLQFLTKDTFFKSLLEAPDVAPGWVYYNSSSRRVNVLRSSGSSGLVITDPTAYNEALLESMVKKSGIKVNNHSEAASEKECQVIADDESEPLSEIIHTTLQRSDNLYAQQLLRTVGVHYRQTKHVQTATLEQAGLLAVQSWLSGIGIPNSEIVMVDGCGLSRKNCITAHALNTVLLHMGRPQLDGPYLNLLKFAGSAKGSSFRYKTGTMDSVRSISGVIRTSTGAALAVSILANGHEANIRDLSSSINSLTAEIEALSIPPYKGEPAPAANPLHPCKPRAASPSRTSIHHQRRRRHQ